VALQSNTTGNDNTATGFAALNRNTTGALNTATGVGSLASSTGDLNVALGFGAGANLATGNNNIDVGNIGVSAEDNVIRVGAQVAVTDPFGVLHPAHTATYIAGIRDADAAGGDAVFVTTDGKLGTISVPSAARFKDEIRPMDKTSEAILALKPVTFRYKKELDPNRVPQFGLVAEEVEKTAPDLVKRDRDGKLQTVRYDAVNAMLLNEFLKEHRKVEQMETTIKRQQEQIEALTAGLQKVTAQIEVKEPIPRMVNNQ
jgi:endosialidase-like protein